MEGGWSQPDRAAGDLAAPPAPTAQGGPGAAGGLGRRAVVHIGLDKTGSSTIQFWLKRNAKRLRKQGIHVDLLDDRQPPALDMVQGFAMYGQAAQRRWLPNRRQARRFGIRTRKDLKARLEDMMARAEASLPPGAGTWIASSEQLGVHLTTEAAIRRQHDWLRSRFDRVDYVCYIRDQVPWVASAYAQALKAGSPASLDEFIAKRGANDYHALARRWTEVVGAGRFHLRLFDDVVRRGDLVSDFADAIGADAAGLVAQEPRNQSTSARRLRAMRLRNVLQRGLKRRGLHGWSRRLDGADPFLARWLDGGPKLRLSPAQAERVRELNRASNEALRAWLFPDRADLFGSPAPTAAPAHDDPTRTKPHVHPR